MKNKVSGWLKRLLLLIILAGSAGYASWRWKQAPPDIPKFETATVSRGELVQAVTASGQLNPVVKVEVGSQISGIIKELGVDFNSPVKKGQVVAELDPATYRAFVHQAEANLATAKAGLELALVNFQRAKSLSADTLIAKSEYDKAVADLHQAEAAVRIHESNLEKAEVDLARCTIYAPIDGIVISRNVNVGQTVAASLSAPTLFLIANDLTKMQIEAKVSEADIGRVQVGQRVKFTVDAFPGETFPGEVSQVRNAPVLDQNVVTYDTIIEVKNPELKLKPGMTANITIVVAQRDNVLKVPNAALRFRPPKDVEVKKIAEKKTEGVAASAGEKPPEDKGKAESSKPKKDKKDKKKAERTVHVLRGGELYALQLKLGITDGRETELIEGLNEGDLVVVDMAETKESPTFAARMAGVFKKKD
jgi:HlyD family secretion protein